MKRHNRVDGIIGGWIRELAIGRGWSAAQIWREILERVHILEDREQEQEQSLAIPVIPHKRTIERLVRELKSETEDAEPEGMGRTEDILWNLTDYEPEVVSKILDVRRQVVLEYREPLPRFTAKEANDLAVIFGAAPDIPARCAYLFAQLYRHYQLNQGQAELQALEDYLAFTPWRPGKYYDSYESKVKAGVLYQVPAWDALVTRYDGWHTSSGEDED